MNKLVVATASAIALMVPIAIAGEAPDPNVAEAKAIIKEFFGNLKGELEQAMKEGGPINAIAVCKGRAPMIAQETSAKHGWDVGRTSLKLRNTVANAPDEWEIQILQQFDVRKANGEDVAMVDYAEVVDQGGQKTFRYMKAIPTQDLCLNCHGTEIKPEVTAELDKLYPGDQARGYTVGDVRGAFTLSKKL